MRSKKQIYRGLSPEQLSGDCPDGKLSHMDEKGKAKMVDITSKQATERMARAACKMIMHKETLDLITSGQVKKGDVFTTAKVAGIMAAKKTAGLIPMCHPLNISSINIEFETRPHKSQNSRAHSPCPPPPACPTLPAASVAGRRGSGRRANAPQGLIIRSEVKLKGKTGAEMEALTAVSVAALTVYDMVKSAQKDIKITDLQLLEKEGGKSGYWKGK